MRKFGRESINCPVCVDATGSDRICYLQNGKLVCNTCQHECCQSCYRQVHHGQSCLEYIVELSKTDESVEYQYDNYSCCPDCHTVIEKNGGCDHIVCLKCGRHFSYIYNKIKYRPFIIELLEYTRRALVVFLRTTSFVIENHLLPLLE